MRWKRHNIKKYWIFQCLTWVPLKRFANNNNNYGLKKYLLSYDWLKLSFWKVMFTEHTWDISLIYGIDFIKMAAKWRQRFRWGDGHHSPIHLPEGFSQHNYRPFDKLFFMFRNIDNNRLKLRVILLSFRVRNVCEIRREISAWAICSAILSITLIQDLV